MKILKSAVSIFTAILMVLMSIVPAFATNTQDTKAYMQSLYGQNKEISGNYDKSLAVKCYNGTFVGKETDRVISFKGIPYAKQPVGNLRWKSPVEAEQSEKVYEAYYFGHTSVQTEWPSEVSSYYPQGEDCLNLNIWTSSDSMEGKPVMVFFHGGSYGWGGTSDPMYDAQNLVSKYRDIVVVTVAYRTGIYGFMDFSETDGGEDYSTAGNLGLLDCACALKWVNKNISSFGGNPDNVTIWGESAGAGIVSLLPLVKEAKGLFTKCIAESGSVTLTSSKAECKAVTKMLLKESGCNNMSELVALGTKELAEINEVLNDYNNFPERDGIVIPEDLYGAYASGEAADITMLIGTNSDESRYWINEMGYYTDIVPGEFIFKIGTSIMYESEMKQLSDEDKALAKSFMKTQNDKKYWNISEYYNEILFRLPAILQAEGISNNGGNAYMYYWKYPSAYENFGACHAVELAYVFNNLDETIYTGDNINKELAAKVQDMWVNFARNGNPSTDEYEWPAYDTKSRETMILDSDIHTESFLKDDSRLTLTPLTKYYFHGDYMEMSFFVPTVYMIAGALIITVAAITGCIILTIKRLKKRKKKAEEV